MSSAVKATDATPVDLVGGYFFAGDGSTVSVQTSGGDRVSEPSGAAEGTYSPFSDATKSPRLSSTSLLGRRFDVEIECLGNWATDVDGVPDRARIGSLAGSAAAVVERDILGYRFRDADDDSVFMTDTTGATKFRVRVQVDGAGQKTLTVTTVNGSAPGSQAQSSLNAHGLSGAAAGFRVSLQSGIGRKGTGQIQVRDFTTTGPANSMYLFADDPYVRPGEPIDYRLGMANLAQPVGGFQAFLAKLGSPSAQTYVTGTYPNTPFPAGRFWGDPIPSSLFLGAGIAFGGSLVTADAKLADLHFTAGTGGTVGLGILAGQGGFDTLYTDDLGIPYFPLRQDSNLVVIDGVGPVVSGLNAVQLGESALTYGLGAGSVLLIAHATDGLSGLVSRPTFRLDYAPLGPGPEDEVLAAYSSSVPNEFRAETAVPIGKLSGPGKLIVTAVDDAGNQTVTEAGFLVARTFSGNIHLQDYDGDVSQWAATIDIRPVGSGTPIASRLVNLDASGNFVLNQTVPDGLYDIRAKAPHWLARLRTNENLNSLAISGLDFSLLNADCNDDNVVDIADYAILSFSYGSYVGDTNFDVLADLNGDEAVDIADYAILSANYSAYGDD